MLILIMAQCNVATSHYSFEGANNQFKFLSFIKLLTHTLEGLAVNSKLQNIVEDNSSIFVRPCNKDQGSSHCMAILLWLLLVWMPQIWSSSSSCFSVNQHGFHHHNHSHRSKNLWPLLTRSPPSPVFPAQVCLLCRSGLPKPVPVHLECLTIGHQTYSFSPFFPRLSVFFLHSDNVWDKFPSQIFVLLWPLLQFCL